MMDTQRLESEREFREAISPQVIEICAMCREQVQQCEYQSATAERRTGETSKAPTLREALEKLLAEYIAERDCFLDGIVLPDGRIQSEGDRQSLAEMDAIIDECQRALAADKERNNG